MKKVAVFLDDDTHRKLKARCASEGIPMLKFIGDLIAAALKKGK